MKVARSDGGSTSVTVEGDGPALVLAHGAGAGQEHPFMVGMRRRLVDSSFTVASFDYPYREEGRKAPDRIERLLACHRVVYDQVVATVGDAPFLVGKSMGGRIGSHLAVASPGRVFLGYPLVPAGRSIPRDVSHLAGLGPMLFIQGARDALAPIALVSGLVAGLPLAELEVIVDADHGFRVPKRTGIGAEAVLDRIVDPSGGVAAAQSSRPIGEPVTRC